MGKSRSRGVRVFHFFCSVRRVDPPWETWQHVCGKSQARNWARRALVHMKSRLAVLLSTAACALAAELPCSACDAGKQCGVCLLLANASLCSSMSYMGNTKCGRSLRYGEMCEGDGECGSNEGANNCVGRGREPLKDVYIRVACSGEWSVRQEKCHSCSSLRWVLVSLSITSVLCGWLLRVVYLRNNRPRATLAASDGAAGVQLDTVPVATLVMVPLAVVQAEAEVHGTGAQGGHMQGAEVPAVAEAHRGHASREPAQESPHPSGAATEQSRGELSASHDQRGDADQCAEQHKVVVVTSTE